MNHIKIVEFQIYGEDREFIKKKITSYGRNYFVATVTPYTAIFHSHAFYHCGTLQRQ
jgi:hypothetical protein